LLRGTRSVKKRKMEVPASTTAAPTVTFLPQPVETLEKGNTTVQFAACVDAAPLIHEHFIYGACQEGVVQRIDMNHINDIPFCFLLGGNWKVQADMVLIEEQGTLVVCGYNPMKETGVVFALSLDLSAVKWKRELEGMIKSTPLVLHNCLYVVAGRSLYILEWASGSDTVYAEKDAKSTSGHVTLQASTESKPLAVAGHDDAVSVLYAFSDWDAGVELVKHGEPIARMIPGVTSPVYADLLSMGEDRVIAADIFGYLHDVNTQTLGVQSTKVASSPIFSSPVLRDGTITFGCHDGVVRCVLATDLSSIVWQHETNAIVYARVCPLPTGEIAVCTTAGDVIILNKGVERWRCRVDGEIWSDPVALCWAEKDSESTPHLVFGARDSKLHIMKI
jgi:outer membrane protein assembly factor BamB